MGPDAGALTINHLHCKRRKGGCQVKEAAAKKYELTSEFIVNFLGIKMFRIKALISFGPVKIGEIGGYVEAEKNLDQSGNAWVYGNARVYGNAQVSGNARVYGNARVSGDAWEESPPYIQTSGFSITMCKKGYLQIGCQRHTIKSWLNRGEEIAKLNGEEKRIPEYRACVEAMAKIHEIRFGETINIHNADHES
jgi:hypothetical protein